MFQLFISKEFETSLLTLLGVSLVLWRRKADNTLSNPCFMALPLNFTTSAFPIPNYFTFKNFVRSHCDWKEKCREGSRQVLFIDVVTVKELPGYPVQNCPSGSSLF
jgi:hypothetical protein